MELALLTGEGDRTNCEISMEFCFGLTETGLTSELILNDKLGVTDNVNFSGLFGETLMGESTRRYQTFPMNYLNVVAIELMIEMNLEKELEMKDSSMMKWRCWMLRVRGT